MADWIASRFIAFWLSFRFVMVIGLMKRPGCRVDYIDVSGGERGAVENKKAGLKLLLDDCEYGDPSHRPQKLASGSG